MSILWTQRFNCISTFQYITGAYRDVGERFLIRKCSERTSSNGFELKGGTFRLGIQKKLFAARVITKEQVAQKSCRFIILASI